MRKVLLFAKTNNTRIFINCLTIMRTSTCTTMKHYMFIADARKIRFKNERLQPVGGKQRPQLARGGAL
jgi:hypothetical protein